MACNNPNFLDIDNQCPSNATIQFCGEPNARKVVLDFDSSSIGTGLVSSSANNTYSGTNTFNGNVSLNGNNVIGNAPTDTLSFFGGTAVTRRTLVAYTPDPETTAYTGIDNTAVGTVFAQLTDLQALRVAYENLRASHEDLRTKMLATGLIA